jgi:FtsP/CotA-like multicopper oxidase with cupredoxin domain
MNAAVVNEEQILVGPPIHVEAGGRLLLNLTNDISYTGLSIRMHGFQFGGDDSKAGSVGVSQCPLVEGNSMTYDIIVNEAPGAYIYSQSGYLGVDAIDLIRGPLIVHPPGEFPDLEESPTAYDDERVLFFQDGSLVSSRLSYEKQIGNSIGPSVRDDDGFVVSTVPWDFGTCNGKNELEYFTAGLIDI